MLTGQAPGSLLRAASMSTFVNTGQVAMQAKCQVLTGRGCCMDRPVSTLVSTIWASPAGSAGPGSRSASRTIVTQSECATLRRCAARYALLVRILALALRQFAPVVHTLGSQPPWREPRRPTCYQKLWFPGGSFHYGFQRIAGVRCPPCRSERPHENHHAHRLAPAHPISGFLRFHRVVGDTLCRNQHGRLASVPLLGLYRM